MNYLASLNDVQRAAVECTDGPVMVIAGPGSGKTRVLTYRVAHLIESGIPPWQILCLTFTNKAAREMKERIEKVSGSAVHKVWAGTFHSIFARILRMEAPKIGYPGDFSIYDTDDTKSAIKSICNSMGLNPKTYNPNKIRSRISSAKSNLITPKLYAQNTELLEYDRMNQMPLIFQIYERYTQKCFVSGAMDFDDLLLQMYRLLYENKDQVKQKYQNAFRYVLVDEFQDTNYLQYAIIKEMVKYIDSPENICVVGDDAQSIYSFRGATIENILQFENDFPNTQTFKLEQNYRSTHAIVSAANTVISENRKQIQKKIWTDREDDHKIKLLKLISDSEEGRRVADLIMEYKNRYHYSNSDFAILYRTNAQSRVFEEHLRRENIAYKVFGGLSFYQRKEVKDFIAYLRLAINPRDDEALKRVINYPRRGIGKKSIDTVAKLANEANSSLWDVLKSDNISGRSANMMREFAGMVASFGRKAQQEDAYKTALYILKKSGLMSKLKEDTSMEGVSRIQNLTAVLDGIKEFMDADELDVTEGLDNKSLASYLQNIALLTDFDSEEEEQVDYVSLMSVHAAKGLEFESVFVVGLEENLFPSFMSMSDMDQLDEERRLFYVSITRAKTHLTLSYANMRYQYGQSRFNDPSRFLAEIPEECYESMPSRRTINRGILAEPKKIGRLAPPLRKKELPKVELKDFKATPAHQIQEGQRVLHQKFGEGDVIAVGGHRNNRIATINFDQLDSEKKIALKFAKLQIL